MLEKANKRKRNNIIAKVKVHYNSVVEKEWGRIANRPEFHITCHYLDKYIKSGDKVLDIGGGPGRYSLYLAAKGCEVTLFDLSENNTKFAEEQAKLQGLKIKTICGDACIADELLSGQFDHVLLMGPMYHLLNEIDRVKAINAALKLLKHDGVLFISFINMIAGIIYGMKSCPSLISGPREQDFLQAFLTEKSFAGMSFTQAYFAKQSEILPFMAKFPLEKLHLLGQESITSPCEGNIYAESQIIIDQWLDLAIKVCEREELLSWSEHLMYIGKKINT